MEGVLMWLFLKPLLPHIGIAFALGALVLWLDHKGYQRAMADRDRRDAAMVKQINDDRRAAEARMGKSFIEISGRLYELEQRRDKVIEHSRTIVKQEIIREPRFSDPAAGISDSLREAINSARSLSSCATGVDGSIQCALPAAAASDQ
jgi:hypothetical protein